MTQGLFSLAGFFWFAVVVSAAWGGWFCMALGISDFYHPMAARGDLLRPLRYGVVAVPILAVIVVFGLWLLRRPLRTNLYVIGLSALLIGTLLPFLPEVDSGYREVHWLGEERYEIPWQYDPISRRAAPGRVYFGLRVSIPNLAPKYERQGDTIMVGKAVDFNRGRGGGVPEERCARTHAYLECQWKRGDVVYSAYGDADLFPSDISDLMVEIADLLDGFKVPPHKP